MSCCLIEFNNLISTAQGVAELRGEWRDITGKSPVGSCRNSLYEMYCYIASKKNINILKSKKIMDFEKYNYKVKEGSEILYIAGTRTDVSKWSQKQIIEYLIKYPKAEGHFEIEEKELKKEIEKNIIDITAKEFNQAKKNVSAKEKN